MGFTARLARFVLDNNSFDKLPADVIQRSKEMMVNAAAVALAAAAQPEGRTLTQFVQEMQGNGKCTIIGMGLRTSPVYAALTNGAMVHLLDFDDEITPRGVHPSCTVFPVVMALGEMNGLAGKDVLTAYALGCEVTSKLAGIDRLNSLEIDLGSSPNWHRDGVAGAIGATIAAALLLKLDQEQTENALGIACGAAAGIQANLASGARALQCGRAAMNGVMAATLAQKGFTGARDAIEAAGGLLDVHWNRAEVDQEAFFRYLADPYDIVHPGVTLKLYPCESASHPAIDALLQLMQQYQIEPGQVASVHTGVTPQALRRLPFATPQNAWEARFCLSYILAATLLYGPPLIDHFTEVAVQDAEVRQMMDRVSVEATEIPTRLIPNPSAVAITLSDGRRLQHRVEFARGQPELPLETEELCAKFLYCSRYILPADHIEEAIDSFRKLENIENVTGMASVLGG
ncbi:MAG: MmgE/PrpD family protein [Chloroflexi bacterium]|nr:MmgE/PrpD family protein [Chloroflexota bacterium]MDA1218352.1 MmgE/PrpD family protein [Chloroflexota bacterium]